MSDCETKRDEVGSPIYQAFVDRLESVRNTRLYAIMHAFEASKDRRYDTETA